MNVGRLFRAASLAVLLCVALLLLSACSSHPRDHARARTATTVTLTTGTTTTTEPVTSACPREDGFMGCASGASSTYSPAPTSQTTLPIRTPSGVRFPDVSNNQGCGIDWARVAAPGAVVKLGEGDSIVDPCAAHNIAGIRATRKALVVYWFVRPDSIHLEENLMLSALKAEHITISHVVIYTAPGTWPGGSPAGLDAWEAAYGPFRPPLPFSAPVLAWQFTEDGYVPGLGYGDVNVNYGLLALSPHVLVLDEEVPGIAGYAAPLARFILTHDPGPSRPASPVLAHPASYYRVFPDRVFTIDGERIDERAVVEAFDRHPTRALRHDLALLAGRIYAVAHQAVGRPRWGIDHRGSRFALITQRLHHRTR